MEINTVKIQGDGYLVNGTISVPNADGNRHYEYVKIWLETNTPEVEFTQDELAQQILNNMETAINNLIQSKIDKYNSDNKVSFTNINSIAKFLFVPTYAHYTFCDSINNWVITVWETARGVLTQVEDGIIPIPTVDELIAMLPEYV